MIGKANVSHMVNKTNSFMNSEYVLTLYLKSKPAIKPERPQVQNPHKQADGANEIYIY